MNFQLVLLWWWRCVRRTSLTTRVVGGGGGGGVGPKNSRHLLTRCAAQRTSSNLLELHPRRGSKRCRVLSHEFGVVRLHRTLSLLQRYRGNKV